MTERNRPGRGPGRRNRLGVFPGDDYDLANVRAVDEWLGGALDVVVTFVQADLSPDRRERFVEQVLTPVCDAGYTPLLTWEPSCLAGDADASPTAQLRAEGLLREWAETLAEWVGAPTRRQRALHVRPAHEPNGWWYPWSAGAGVTGREYVEFWHALVAAFEDHGPPAAAVTWVWCINAESTDGVTLADYYPGDSVVDWAGVDGFNWGTSQPWSEWQQPEAVFGDAVEAVREVTDAPLVIPEVGCSSATDSGDGVHRKASWTEAAFDFFAAEDVTFVGWFDADKETDWAICAQPGPEIPEERTLRGREYGVYPAFERAAGRYRGAPARRD